MTQSVCDINRRRDELVITDSTDSTVNNVLDYLDT